MLGKSLYINLGKNVQDMHRNHPQQKGSCLSQEYPIKQRPLKDVAGKGPCAVTYCLQEVTASFSGKHTKKYIQLWNVHLNNAGYWRDGILLYCLSCAIFWAGQYLRVRLKSQKGGSSVQWPLLITKHKMISSETKECGIPLRISFCTLVKPQFRWLIWGLSILKTGGWQQNYSITHVTPFPVSFPAKQPVIRNIKHGHTRPSICLKVCCSQ